jgi:uncharacterized membrane protein SpoIIM required for sporulation
VNQAAFVASRQARWEHYQALLKALRKRDRHARPDDFPSQYRSLCNDLALAQSRGYSLSLVARLEQWVMEGHQFLYQPRGSLGSEIVNFLRQGFPTLVRQEWRLVLVCSLLLFGPMLWLFWHIGTSPEFVYRVLSPEMVDQYEQMYGREDRMVRSAEDEVFMFAFYIMNNIGVALRTFAGGLVFGLGSFLILLFNGVQIGAVAAHLSFAGHHENFWTFVIGHGAFELPAIALAGAAGARMGLSLLLPGDLRRIEALRLSARRAVRLLYGVMLMLLLAAGLEAFWSASTVPATVKYTVGGFFWALVFGYFLLAGRVRRAAHAD